MRIESPYISVSCHQNERCSSSNHSSFFDSSIALTENGIVKKGSFLLTIFEDVIGFFRNIILFPFLGHQIILYQIISIIIFPFLIPYIVITEILYAILNICTCGCLKSIHKPKLDLSPPNNAEKALLNLLVKKHGHSDLSFDHQISLTHIISRYLDYVNRYASSEEFGPRYGRFQSLIKIAVDEKEQLFQCCPKDNKQQILKNYLRFIKKNLTSKSRIKHHFIDLDYQYILGLLKMKLQTNTITYDCENEVEESFGICGGAFRLFAPTIGKHMKKKAQYLDHFAFWPEFTRVAICKKINSLLESNDIESTQISLLELKRLIRG